MALTLGFAHVRLLKVVLDETKYLLKIAAL